MEQESEQFQSNLLSSPWCPGRSEKLVLFSPWIFPLSSSALGPSARTLQVQSHLHTVVQRQRHSKLSIMDDFIVATYCVLSSHVESSTQFASFIIQAAHHATTHIHTQMHRWARLLPIQEGMEAQGDQDPLSKVTEQRWYRIYASCL